MRWPTSSCVPSSSTVDELLNAACTRRWKAYSPSPPLAPNGPLGQHLLSLSLSGFDRYCRKRILWVFPRNIDSREEPYSQHRFKTLFGSILLLRFGEAPRTFSTASVKSGKARPEHMLSAFTPLATFERTCRDVGVAPLTDIFSRAAPSSSSVASGSRSPSKKALIGIAGNDRVHVHHQLKSRSQMK